MKNIPAKLTGILVIGILFLNPGFAHSASDKCFGKNTYQLLPVNPQIIKPSYVPGLQGTSTGGEEIGKLLTGLGYVGEKGRKEFNEAIRHAMVREKNNGDLGNIDTFKWGDEEGWPGHFVIQDGAKNPIFQVVSTPAEFWDHYYVIFAKESTGWVIRGTLYVFSKYSGDKLSLVEFQDKLFLSVMGSSGGTGMYGSWFNVYVLNDGPIHKVLSYPGDSRREEQGGSPNYMIQSTTGPIQFKNGKNGCYLEVPTSINYYGLVPAGKTKDPDDDEYKSTDLFTKKYNIQYWWDEAGKVFLADEKQSQPTVDPDGEIDVDQRAGDFFIKFYGDIKKIAKHPTKDQKIWLKGFLDWLKDVNDPGIIQKRLTLLKMLGNLEK
jgi:hypothetical protein